MERIFLRNLAELCWHKGKDLYESKRLFELSIEVYKNTKSSSAQHKAELGTTLHFYASLLMTLCEAERSKANFEEALRLKEAIDRKSTEVAITCENFAILLADQGEYEDALSLALRAFEIQKSALGKSHPDLGATCNTIAYILYELGIRGFASLHSAYRFARYGAHQRQRAFIEMHGDVSESINRLALCSLALGKLSEAWKHALYGLRLRMHPSNEQNKSSVANSLIVIGKILKQASHFELAAASFEQANQLFAETLNVPNRGSAYALQCLGELKLREGKRQEAAHYFKAGFDISEMIGKGHRLSRELDNQLAHAEELCRNEGNRSPTKTTSGDQMSPLGIDIAEAVISARTSNLLAWLKSQY